MKEIETSKPSTTVTILESPLSPKSLQQYSMPPTTSRRFKNRKRKWTPRPPRPFLRDLGVRLTGDGRLELMKPIVKLSFRPDVGMGMIESDSDSGGSGGTEGSETGSTVDRDESWEEDLDELD